MKIFRITGIIIFSAVVLCLVCIGVIIFAAFLNSPAETIPAEGALFQVNEKESGEHIIVRLENEKLIRSGLFLRILSKLTGSETSFKKGMYRIKPGNTTLDIHDILVSGREEMLKITLLEGWTSSKMALYFEEKGFILAKDFLQIVKSKEILEKYRIPADTAEGYLFPDTYYFPVGVSAQAIVIKMIDTFFQKIDEYTIRDKPYSPEELHKKVIMASIIEREYRSEEEAPIIASVFYNRLKNYMPLESCATIAYVISEIKGKPYPKRIYYADLEIQSAYNTYRYNGLPPGPISNPGLTALVASLSPASTSYLYFVLKDPQAGVHEFSDSFSQHQAAKNLYIKTD
ncbi:MAG: endolytic transglycosylase MltG [Spirochaetales bacterium]|nr:endolytic transglycosylase MltG [Spirochaetales bacterium]